MLTNAITEFPGRVSPVDITAGIDGTLWFTELTGNYIGGTTIAGVIPNIGSPILAFAKRIAAGRSFRRNAASCVMPPQARHQG